MWLVDHGSAINAPPIRSAADAAHLLGDGLSRRRREALVIVHLDERRRPIAIARQVGKHDSLDLELADIVRDACQLGSRQLLIAHNHPSGDPMPSLTDRIATRRLAELMRLLGIELIDHLIFAKGGIVSFRGLGLL